MSHLKKSLFILCLFATSCSTPPEEKKESILLPQSEQTYQYSHPKSGKANKIDVSALIDELDMIPPGRRLGFQEKSFNTCEIKSNQSPKPLCQRLYLIRVNYQVVCRSSTGTVSKVQLHPLNKGRIGWRHKGYRGHSWTDPHGYGSLGFISPKSAAQGHLYFRSGYHVARKQFRDNWKLVLPGAWCKK